MIDRASVRLNDEVAFVGTGLIGAPIADRLIGAGYPVRVWNRSAHKADALGRRGGILCATAAEAIAGSAFACLCLTDADAAEDLLFGDSGAAAALTDTSVVVDFSTIGVAPTRAFAARVAAQTGAAWLDCPVSGGVAGAAAGTLTIFAGGDARVLDRARPLLGHVAARVTWMGGTGAGQATKLCNQLIVATNLLAIAEAIALGEALGIDTARLPAALAGGFADSRLLQLFGPRMAAMRDPGPSTGRIGTMLKDISAVLDAASAAGTNMSLIAQVGARYRALTEAGFSDEDLPSLMRLYRDPPVAGVDDAN